MKGFALSFDILIVCHANLCRSPLAEGLARRLFDETFGPDAVTVASAGTHGWDGSPMHQGSAQVLAECGVPADAFVSRTVDARILNGSDLVLTAAREQRAACVTLAPATVGRTFTLRQFARYAAAVQPAAHLQTGTATERMHALVKEVARVRHLVPLGEDDLADPMGRPIEAFRTCAEEVWAELTTIVRVISNP